MCHFHIQQHKKRERKALKLHAIYSSALRKKVRERKNPYLVKVVFPPRQKGYFTLELLKRNMPY